MRRIGSLLCLLSLSMLACGGDSGIGPPPQNGQLPAEAVDAAALIQPQFLREAVTRLAADEMEESWNYEGLVEDAVLAFSLALTVANADQMPGWYPGDEFEDERQRALEEVTE